MTSSGTGGLESAVQNCFSPGDEVFVPLAGFFAERWKRAGRGLRAHRARRSSTSGGRSSIPTTSPRALAEHPRQGRAAHAERDLDRRDPARSRARRASRATPARWWWSTWCPRLGAVPFDFDGWGIDVASAARRRRCPRRPGIAFVAVSDRAWQPPRRPPRTRASTSTGAIYRQFAALPDPENPWTPAISVMQGLHAALELYFQDGVDAAHGAAPDRSSRAVKEGAQALGLDLFGEGLEDNWTVTAIRAPEGIDADTICDRIRSDFGVRARARAGPAQGQGLPDRTLRLLQRARHHPRPGGARDDARAARATR